MTSKLTLKSTVYSINFIFYHDRKFRKKLIEMACRLVLKSTSCGKIMLVDHDRKFQEIANWNNR